MICKLSSKKKTENGGKLLAVNMEEPKFQKDHKEKKSGGLVSLFSGISTFLDYLILNQNLKK